MKARNQVNMEMRNGLSSRGAVIDTDVVCVGPESVIQDKPSPIQQSHQGFTLTVFKLEKGSDMTTRDDQRMTG